MSRMTREYSDVVTLAIPTVLAIIVEFFIATIQDD